MAKYLLAHDLGTSGNKATLFDTQGRLIKSKTSSYPTNYFNGNHSEQNPEDWLDAVIASTHALMDGINKDDLLAISFSGQMMGCVVVDDKGKALRPAIIWSDQRSTKEADYLRSVVDEDSFYHITGHRISPSYSIEKLMWIKNNQPEVYAKTYKMLNAKDYIVAQLTGKFATDYSDASSTNAFDLNTFTWSEDIIKASGIHSDKFPDVHPSTYNLGSAKEKYQKSMGIGEQTAIILGAGDGVCSALGAGSVEEGDAYCYLGSSAWVAVTSKKPYYHKDRMTFNWAHAVPGYVTPCGTMQAAGNSYGWLKKELCKEDALVAQSEDTSTYVLMNKRASNSPMGAKGLIYHPYLLGERSPRWNSDCRGSFIGLKMEHSLDDMIRSVIEGIFMNMSLISDALKEHTDFSSLKLIGGLAQGKIQRDIMANTMNLELEKLEYLEEATSMGAAVIAGVGVGCYENFNAITDFIKVDEIEKPIEDNVLYYHKLRQVFNHSYECLLPVYEELKKL